MHTLDAKMALWREVYAQLKEARSASKADPTNLALTAEVDRLQRACGVALDAMQTELARLKAGGDSTRDSM